MGFNGDERMKKHVDGRDIDMSAEEIAALEADRAEAARRNELQVEANRVHAIKAQLADLDFRSIRAIREDDHDRLRALEAEAAALRGQL